MTANFDFDLRHHGVKGSPAAQNPLNFTRGVAICGRGLAIESSDLCFDERSLTTLAPAALALPHRADAALHR